MLPMMQIVGAITTLGLPSVAFEFGRKNLSEMKRKSFRISWVLILLSAAYALLLLALARPAEHLLYGGQFVGYTSLIPLIGMIPLLASIESGYLLVVRSLRRPVYYAVLTGVLAIVGVISGWFFIARWGIAGAVLGLTSVAIVSMLVNVWFYKNWFLPLAKQSS